MDDKPLNFEPFTIWMASEYGKIPIQINGIELDDVKDGQVKLDIKYELLVNDEEFPKQLFELDDDAKNEFLLLIRIAVHNCFREFIEKEMNE